MSIAASSTERSTLSFGMPPGPLAGLVAVLRFRFRSRGQGRVRRLVGLAIFLGLSALIAIVPAVGELPPPLDHYGLDELRPYLDGLLPAFLAVGLLSSVTTGGGREVLSRDQAVAFPISPAVDHLGALVLAPLNLAWIVQSWLLVAISSYAGGPRGALPGVLLALAWMLVATAVAQALGWAVEWLRRGPHGRLVVGAGGALLLAGGAVLQARGILAELAAASPTGGLARELLATRADGFSGHWAAWLAGLLLTAAVASLAGMPLAAAVARRPSRDVERADARVHAARPDARTPLALVTRLDRTGVLRSVPLRRGLLVLTLLPGLGALVMPAQWSVVTVLVGLVASGAALLFAVNAWCLDGRGQLWRESLPVAPSLVFDARTRVVAELLLGCVLVTVGLAAIRAGAPSVSELVALAVAVVVCVGQVTATAMSWSTHTPHQADMRSSRAIPAPPVVMMGYSTKLSLSTTLTCMVLGTLGATGHPGLAIGLAVPMLAWSAARLLRARRAWADPQVRALVTVVVAA